MDSSVDTSPVAAGIALSSHFQPIYSLAHRRPVAYEGLLRARDAAGRPVAPAELFARTPLGEARVRLDRQCRRLHVENFLRSGDSRSWLFLNVDPYVATEGTRFGSFFAQFLQSQGMGAHRVAIELIESPVTDEGALATAVDYYRRLGCLLVIDDFGAGYSNFDRIWRLKPDIVKIDREMTRRVSVEPLARRMFSGIISVLHEAGALVCVEGIETEAEALCATDAGADMVQGYYFGRPAEALPAEDACQGLFARLFENFHLETGAFEARRRERLTPYLAALDSAARALGESSGFAAAAAELLGLECTQRCYLIGGDGTQIGANLEAERNVSARDGRLEPMRPRAGTNWQIKPYFRRAIHAPGRIQITRPYLSVTGPRLCITLSLAFVVEGALRVLCADLDFASLAGDNLSFGTARLNRV